MTFSQFQMALSPIHQVVLLYGHHSDSLVVLLEVDWELCLNDYLDQEFL
jgi:hypothetical protein